ncbi:CDP-alcohol phosphatidyltransferase family protein [Legionella londiniensis]|uniref:Putative phosphatidoglycerophosphate synthase n=1 Tax=Legionella londiniensis TaxID=45068 RepID=A0A0W0VS37_9GAMM|nr:CDP-alcohol phosphatidyltransferase family protein [Legionella londiniensis]KTD22923.1 putative phosphatidoglycerophosphate synthase [Legionella londiniensis]STX92969.1 putative phosphatidoglycerophosphate synthase [Legionella londiniensis]
MIEQSLRRYYQSLLVDPSAGYLKAKISPNGVTLLSGLFGFLVLPALWFQQTLLAVSLLLISGYCDTLDGTLARFSQTTSAWGSVLDIMMDRAVEFIVVFALWSVAPDDRGFWCLMMLGSMLMCITSFLVVGIFTENNSEKGFHYSPGIMERAEAFIFFIAMMIWPNVFTILAALFSLLVFMTAGVRLYQFYIQQKG